MSFLHDTFDEGVNALARIHMSFLHVGMPKMWILWSPFSYYMVKRCGKHGGLVASVSDSYHCDETKEHR